MQKCTVGIEKERREKMESEYKVPYNTQGARFIYLFIYLFYTISRVSGIQHNTVQ